MDKSLILSRLKTTLNFSTDTELADFLGISKSVLSNWYKRNSIDWDLVFTKCEHIDYNILIKGSKSAEDVQSGISDITTVKLILERYEAVVSENALLKSNMGPDARIRGHGSKSPPGYKIGGDSGYLVADSGSQKEE